MKQGDFTEEDIANAKKGILATIKTIDDEQDTQISYYFGQELTNTRVSTEEYIKKIEKIQKEDFLTSITSNEFTKYDGLGVIGLNANHLSASQLGSYAKCPLKYLYINKLRIRTPREDEDGFDVAQMGTLMHSCFESFAKKVQGNKNLGIEAFKSIMFEVLSKN